MARKVTVTLTEVPPELLTRLNALMEAKGYSPTDVARLAGLGASTVSEIRSGKYKGSGRNVFERIRKWLDFEEGRIFLPMEVEPLDTDTLTQIHDALAYAHQRQRGAIIIGESGCGKSIAAQAYAERSPSTYYILCTEGNRGKDMLLQEISEVIGAHITNASRAKEVYRSVVKKLRDAHAMLIFDDAQRLMYRAIDLIQSLHDDTRCAFALIGMPTLYSELTGSKTSPWYAQILSRSIMNRSFSAREISRADVALVAGLFANERDINPDALDKLYEIAHLPGGLRRVEQVMGLATTFAKEGSVDLKSVTKAHAYRGNI